MVIVLCPRAYCYHRTELYSPPLHTGGSRNKQRAERSKKPLSTKEARGDNSLAEFTGQWTRCVHTHASPAILGISLSTRDITQLPRLPRHWGESGVRTDTLPRSVDGCQCWTRQLTPLVEPLRHPVEISKHTPKTPLLFKLRCLSTPVVVHEVPSLPFGTLLSA